MMLQLGFGYSPARSGAITFAGALGAIGMKPGTQWVLRRFGFRRTLVVNGIICAGGLALCAAFRPSWPVAVIFACLTATGFLRSLQFAAYNSIAYADVPPTRMSAAATLYVALQQVSLTIGIPISAGVVSLARTGAGHALPTPQDFSAAFLIVATISLLSGPMSLILPRDAGQEMSGHQARPGKAPTA